MSSPTKKTPIKFARRTSSGRIQSLSRDDIDLGPELTSTSSGGPNNYANYTVMMPPTPDNAPFTSASKSEPKQHGGGMRGGSNESRDDKGKMDRRMSVIKTNHSMLMRTQTSDFDHTRWLFEGSKGTYGIGNAFWPQDGGYDDDAIGGMGMDDFIEKPWKPLTRKVRVSPEILSPYRLLVALRLVVLIFFLTWRVRNPNWDAMWLWGMSIVCEIWFAFSWVLDILPKLNPINRATDLEALKEKFESPSPSNPHGRSDLPGLDVFISTADPEKEPPLVTANTILSILATEYPVEKLACYISDDGAAILTFEAMAEATSFAEVWVPFCRKHSIEPRNPESYFSIKGDPTKNKKRPDFIKDRRYNELIELITPVRFGSSQMFLDSIRIAEFQGRPLADHPSVKNGRPPGALLEPRPPLDAPTVAEAVSVISCWYEDKTEWGERVGWIYGSVTEDVVTGYRMHNRGWRSVYCVTKRDAFRGTAPINLTDRLHQVLRWATGSVEIFFSRNNALLATKRLKFLQRVSYLNVGIYPFTSIFLTIYCFLPALSLFSGQFIVQTLNITFLCYLLTITICLCLISLLEVKWSGIGLEELWRNEQFWVIGGTSAHIVAVIQGLLKVIAGIEISFTLTSKSANEDEDDIYADLYVVKWTSLFIPPLTIISVNLIALVIGFSRTIYSEIPQWSKMLGGGFFSFWVLSHMYPFAKGLMGRRGRTPTILYVWAGLLSITISLLWISISPPSGTSGGVTL